VRLAGELADGVILDAGGTVEQARDVFAITAEGRAAAGRSGEPFDDLVFVEIDTSAPDLAARIDESVAALAGVGASTVVFQPTLDAPDPEPLIAAWAKRG
jgi:hypothetical protein